MFYIYSNQICHVNWSNERSDSFNVSNGVKQGSVISPMLFSIYVDNLFLELKQLGLGCHVGLEYAGSFGYADDIALICPTFYGLKKMISVCELYALDYHITFNPLKSKLICFNIDPSVLPVIYLNGQPISITSNDVHLGNYVSSDIYERNIMHSICDLYQGATLLLMIFLLVIVSH